MKAVVFGGAFDPPHIEHVNLCRAAVRELGADALVIVPTYSPPHKSSGFLDFDVRCELCRAAFDGIARDLYIDTIEKGRDKGNYTCNNLPVLKERYGDIVFLIGGDSLEFIPTWQKPHEIMKICPIAVAEREGYDNISESAVKVKAELGGEIIILDFKGKDVSSSMIKARLLLGFGTDDLPLGAVKYIKEHDLFKNYDDLIVELRERQSVELFEHTVQVVLRAVDLNSKHNLKQDFKKVFVAALLHDNAKDISRNLRMETKNCRTENCRSDNIGMAESINNSVDDEKRCSNGVCCFDSCLSKIPVDSVGTPVMHQFLGAELAKTDFGVTDEDVLDAIRYHTTAKADMTVLEKLIYTADSTSLDRDYPPIPELRRIADEDFDAGFKAVLGYTYKKVKESGKGMYPLTENAKKYYLD